jgi:inorganic phosphate transporter, PiT family
MSIPVKFHVNTGMNPTEKLFCGFAIVTAAFQSLSHGGNDVANSVGPFAAVLAAYDGDISKKSDVPLWVFFVAGFMICVGLCTYGKNVMLTIGKSMTNLQPSKAFCAELCATFVILIASKVGESYYLAKLGAS